MTIHLYRSNGDVEVIHATRENARRTCTQRVADSSDVYRAAIYDTLSTRYTFDTDDAWLAVAS